MAARDKRKIDLNWVDALRDAMVAATPPPHARTTAQLVDQLVPHLDHNAGAYHIAKLAKKHGWESRMYGRNRYYWPKET